MDMDRYIENLLCADCNVGWARELEEEAGANLFRFLHEDGPLDAQLMKRWLVFFTSRTFSTTRGRRG